MGLCSAKPEFQLVRERTMAAASGAVVGQSGLPARRRRQQKHNQSTSRSR